MMLFPVIFSECGVRFFNICLSRCVVPEHSLSMCKTVDISSLYACKIHNCIGVHCFFKTFHFSNAQSCFQLLQANIYSIGHGQLGICSTFDSNWICWWTQAFYFYCFSIPLNLLGSLMQSEVALLKQIFSVELQSMSGWYIIANKSWYFLGRYANPTVAPSYFLYRKLPLLLY